jgi:hypothetical protein
LLLGQGLSITPLDEGAGNGSIGPRSLFEVVRQIDNQKDFQDYILSYEHNPGAVTSEQIQYQRHPVGSILSIIYYLHAHLVLDTGRYARSRCSGLAAFHTEQAPVNRVSFIIFSTTSSYQSALHSAIWTGRGPGPGTSVRSKHPAIIFPATSRLVLLAPPISTTLSDLFGITGSRPAQCEQTAYDGTG